MRLALTRAIRVLADCVNPLLGGGTTIQYKAKANAGQGIQSPGRSRSTGRISPTRSFFEPLEERAMMSNSYFVSNSGSDSNNGTSVYSPWKSIGKVNSSNLKPGDQVLFQGGQTFGGGLNISGQGGSPTDPVVIGSYGSGHATISSGTGRGAYVLGSSGITIENLNFVGTPGATNFQDGIRIENYSPNSVKSGFTVTGCDISGYAEGGIIFGSDSASEGLNNVSITNNNIYNNVMAGIESYAVTTYSNTNVYIGGNQVHDNYGDNKSTVTGSGIMLQGLTNATVERNNAYNNGAIGGNGGVGIWAYSSDNVTFQYNISHDNHGLHGDDGDGFDFDADVKNSVMQYNLAYNNDGGGFQLNNWWNDNNSTNDIIRFNISQNNGRKNAYSNIDVWGRILNAQIYNNTCYTSPALNGTTSDIRISNNEISNLFPSNIYVANNIFVSTGGTPIIEFYSGALRGASNIVFAGNVYYSYSGASNIQWGSTRYTDLNTWRSSTGEEKYDNQNVGAYANPLLTAPGQASAPASAYDLSSVTAYNLQPGSSIVDVGVNLNSLLGLASPLTGTSSTKTIPGVDQHLAGASNPDSGGGSAGSAGTSTVNKLNSTTLVGWDIGNTNQGSNSWTGNTDTVTGGGSGITGDADSFRYAWTTLTGNGQITAQVSSMSNGSGVAQAGVMIRASNDANAPEVSMLINPGGKTASLVWRSIAGQVTTTHAISANGAQWVKLVRSGNYYSGYISTDGSNWTLVGVIYLNLSPTVSIGLAATASAWGSTETAVFRNVAPSAG